jgi:hypothetical protein
LNHINPIVGPYMSHIIWFCKGVYCLYYVVRPNLTDVSKMF